MTKEYEMKCLAGDEPRILVTPEFVTKNNLCLTPSSEIKSYYEKRKNDDMFGFEMEILFDYMTSDDLTPYIEADRFDEFSKQHTQKADIMECAQDFLDYMVFAWMKACDERGISASRSVSKLGAYLFILGRSDLATLIHDDELYNPYGAPALIAVCEKLGIAVPDYLVEFAKHKC